VLHRRSSDNQFMKFFIIFVVCIILYMVYILISAGPVTTKAPPRSPAGMLPAVSQPASVPA